jgi:ubiquinone/menaquinone biosynthesis C-methylase UbiE
MSKPPLDAPLGRAAIERIYNRIGRRYDLLRFAEGVPKRWAIAQLAVQPGERVLEVGVGTGAVLLELARAAASDEPRVFGVDLSPEMLRVAREKLAAAGLSKAVELREGDACALPYDDASMDALFSSYVLDLLSFEDIGRALAEFGRVLRPGGRLALIWLSPGSSRAARLFTAGYEKLYRSKPVWFAGCRPVRLAEQVEAHGFGIQARRAWFRGHPSEGILAQKAT